MDPGFAAIAPVQYAIAFACIGLFVGVLVKRNGVLFTIVGALAIAVGLVNGFFAPSLHKVEAGLFAFLFVAVVVGFVAALAHILRRMWRGNSTAV